MDATPDGAKQNRRKLYAGSALADMGPDDFCTWLVQLAFECGLSHSSGMGLSSMPWSEIISWQKATCNNSLWMGITIRSLSVAYVSEVTAAKEVSRGSPLADRVDKEEQRKAVSNQLKKFIGA